MSGAARRRSASVLLGTAVASASMLTGAGLDHVQRLLLLAVVLLSGLACMRLARDERQGLLWGWCFVGFVPAQLLRALIGLL